MKRGVAFSADVDTRAFMKAMKIIRKEALPAAVAETLNITADATTKEQIKNVKSRLTVRTPYTLKSMVMPRANPYKALNKAKGRNITRMFSRAGTVSKYLWMQEGFTKKGIGGGPVPIARNLTRAGASRMGIIRRPFRLSRSQSLGPGPVGGKQFIGTPKGGGRPYGLYERRGNNKRLAMLRSLTRKSVRIKDTNFHDDAVKRYGTKQFIAANFKRIAQRELARRIR